MNNKYYYKCYTSFGDIIILFNENKIEDNYNHEIEEYKYTSNNNIFPFSIKQFSMKIIQNDANGIFLQSEEGCCILRKKDDVIDFHEENYSLNEFEQKTHTFTIYPIFYCNDDEKYHIYIQKKSLELCNTIQNNFIQIIQNEINSLFVFNSQLSESIDKCYFNTKQILSEIVRSKKVIANEVTDYNLISFNNFYRNQLTETLMTEIQEITCNIYKINKLIYKINQLNEFTENEFKNINNKILLN